MSVSLSILDMSRECVIPAQAGIQMGRDRRYETIQMMRLRELPCLVFWKFNGFPPTRE